ncbi:AlwI family type II restriction endonuclease [candidate division WOR-3 bacterium]|nr:AlwI family type II restriction endonuclease [candidate division WOR-3 bacterium]
MSTEMGKAGLTVSGKTITHQSIRTLLANLPKYLGFVYLDETSHPARIIVTDVGYELINKHNIAKTPKHKNLREYATAGDLIEISEVFKKQMSKLIITNPIIKQDCENILVFPFRITLRLLLELEYLDIEEIGYILFHTKSEAEFSLIIEKIRNFRNLSPDRREAEILAYKETEEGKLTLVKAPTAMYYIYLCFSTGLCNRVHIETNKSSKPKLPAIVLKNKGQVIQLLEKFKYAETYNFKDNWFLWKEYFCNPNRLYPPHDISIITNTSNEVLTAVIKDNYLVGSDVISKDKSNFILPVFRDEGYRFVAYDLKKGNPIFNKVVKFSKEHREFIVDLNKTVPIENMTKKLILQHIHEMFSGKYSGFDREYLMKLKILKKVLSIDYIDNRRKGGRLEYLFSDLLNLLMQEGIIDDVFWFGRTGKYGIAEPALGGKEGYPDIIFHINNYIIVLEVTTIRGTRAQWSSAEASSVPDHIAKVSRAHPKQTVIGIFSAPSIHKQLKQNLCLNAKEENVGMICEPCITLAEFLSISNKEDLLEFLISKSEEQLSST